MAVGRWVLQVRRGAAVGRTGGAFPPYSGGQSGTLLTTHAYVYAQDRPHFRFPARVAITPPPRPDTRACYVPTDAPVTTNVDPDDETHSAVRLTP
jgi:hypothetical protein